MTLAIGRHQDTVAAMNMRPGSTVLGEHGVDEFLSTTWRQKAAFFPSALTGFRSPITAGELAGLACEPHVESRLVQKTSASPWSLRSGPFDEQDFTSLGTQDWTVLVQDVDKHVPDVAALLNLLSFLPSWCVDDIMISYAVTGGSVGPHTDQYDVFLLQAEGERHWQLGSSPRPYELRCDTELRVLQHFEPDESFHAQVGDVLYIPPGVGHWGVATSECMTYSFGFRSPTCADLLRELGENTSAEDDRQIPLLGLQPGESRAQVPAHVIASVVQGRAPRLDVREAARGIGQYLTTPKSNLQVAPVRAKLTASKLRHPDGLWRDPATKWLFSDCAGALDLYVDGFVYSLPEGSGSRLLAQTLCEASCLTPAFLAASQSNPGTRLLLGSLYQRGCLRLLDEI